MVYIYVLALKNNKYYVGKTNNPQFRLDSHFSANGSEWTIKYKPLYVVELIPNCDNYDEDKITIKYMDKYGIDNVRGGSFVAVVLSTNTIEHLKQMSNGTNDKCFKCGKSGHFARDCMPVTVINTNTNSNTLNNTSPTTPEIVSNSYNICINGAKCKGCRGTDRCNSNKTEVLNYDGKIFYDNNNEIYEQCAGKYNCIYHNTGIYRI